MSGRIDGSHYKRERAKKVDGQWKKAINMKTPRLTGRRVSRLVGGLGMLIPKHLRISVAGSVP